LQWLDREFGWSDETARKWMNVYELSWPGDQYFGIHVSNHDRVMIFAGGIPLTVSGVIVGAVGGSGGSGEQDQSVAEAAAAVCS
jgi:uncharacterized protein GlcG (DUF336 family)